MQQLFKGYVPTQDKRCLVHFKNKTANELSTFDQIQKFEEYAGVLDDNVILIDIDDYEQSEILMKIVEDKQLRCRVYETRRGKHFLFLNKTVDKCRTHTALAVGLESDIKVGCKNSYEVLKFENKERKIIYDIFEDEDYDYVPKWLLPIGTNADFLNMEAGDGRNQALFNYILTLQSNDFSVDEARECIRIINDYVLPEPLDEREIETILRDDSFQKPVFYKGNSFLFDKFARYLRSNDRIVKINGQLHVYSNGVYVAGENEIESRMINHIPSLSAAKRVEVLKYLNVLIRENTSTGDANFIAFRNGIYNLETDEFEDFDPSKIVTNKIDHDYNPDASYPLLDKTLDKLSCNDRDVRALLEEAVGYCFYRRNELRKSFILTGDKKNGKSTYLAMVKELLGDDNTAALDLSELGDRFSVASLFGKLANIGDDIGDEFIPNPALFKKVVSGDRIKGENKGQKEFFFNPYCKLLFSANNIPRIKDKSGAVIDRLVIIPFDAQFSADSADFDPYIKYKLITEESLEYLILLGLQGLKRVLQNRGFTLSAKVNDSLEEYRENNNPILLFFKEITEDDVINESTKKVYGKYNEFCLANTFTPLSNVEFSKQVKKYYDVDIANKSINGKKYRIFVRK